VWSGFVIEPVRERFVGHLERLRGHVELLTVG
jgi:hypothetical protein